MHPLTLQEPGSERQLQLQPLLPPVSPPRAAELAVETKTPYQQCPQSAPVLLDMFLSPQDLYCDHCFTRETDAQGS